MTYIKRLKDRLLDNDKMYPIIRDELGYGVYSCRDGFSKISKGGHSIKVKDDLVCTYILGIGVADEWAMELHEKLRQFIETRAKEITIEVIRDAFPEEDNPESLLIDDEYVMDPIYDNRYNISPYGDELDSLVISKGEESIIIYAPYEYDIYLALSLAVIDESRSVGERSFAKGLIAIIEKSLH